ncbi:MAG TPA: glycosyltransferase family 4 protein [Rhodanobacteraceae bacterium]
MNGEPTPRVLMLGWEYPPRFTGGLGKASQGIAHGLSDLGLDVLFLLPHFTPRRSGKHLRVAGAREWLLACGARHITPDAGKLQWLDADIHLTPYARPSTHLAANATIKPTHRPLDRPVQDKNAIYGSDLGHQVKRFADYALTVSDRARADLVHAHDWMTFPAAVAVAERHHLPLFLHVHSTEFDRSGDGANPAIAAIERRACQRATHVFAVSDYTRHVLITHYDVPADKVSVVYNAPDGPLPALPHSDRSRRQPWIVFLGRLTFQKGPDHFLTAAAIAAKHNPKARFLICGSGDMRERLQRQAQDLGVADRVEFRGFLTPGRVDRLLAQASLLVMPSVSEPFGLVALEALRAGTPVIVSRQSGVREVIGHSLQADFWDHAKLADQMLAVLRLPILAEQLVDEGRAQLASLSWDTSAIAIVRGYAQAGIALGPARLAIDGETHGA